MIPDFCAPHRYFSVDVRQADVMSLAFFDENSTAVVQARSQNCQKRLLVLSCLSVCMAQLGSYWTDFHEILYSIIFRKSVEKIQVSLKRKKE